MEYIKINPIEELLKAIAIVHGRQYAMNLRIFLSKIQDQMEVNEAILIEPHFRDN